MEELNVSNEEESNKEVETPQEKMVTAKAFYAVKSELKEYKEKYKEWQAEKERAEEAKLSEVERLNKQIEKLNSNLSMKEKEILNRDIKDKKTSIFFETRKSIGEGFTVDSETENKLFDKVSKLPFEDDETFKNDVTDLFEMAKKPVRTMGKSPINLGDATQNKKANDYTMAELKELALSGNEELLDRIYAERTI